MSEWKAHDGGPQPEETKGKMVFLFLRDGTKLPTPRAANALEWIDDGSDSAISLYRVLSDAQTSEEPVKTLRDEFAMAALTGIVGGYWGTEQMSGLGPSEFADEAYQIADAMLAARKEK